MKVMYHKFVSKIKLYYIGDTLNIVFFMTNNSMSLNGSLYNFIFSVTNNVSSFNDTLTGQYSDNILDVWFSYSEVEVMNNASEKV